MHTMASGSDDIDAGWDDEPTRIHPALSSAARHSVPSAAPPTPVAFAARPRGLAASSESLSPSTNSIVTVPRSLRPASQTRFIVKLSAAAALAAVLGFTVRRATLADGPAPAHVAAQAPTLEQVARAPQAPAPSPASAAVPGPTAAAVPASIPTVDARSLVTAAPAAATVRVKSIPEGAIFFEGGKRLGTSVIEVAIEPRAKRNFTALLNGYEPLNFKVDGTRSQLNVRLSRAVPVEKKAPSEDSGEGAAEPGSKPEAATNEAPTTEQQPEQ